MTIDYLTVIKRVENTIRNEVVWQCKCSCGKIVDIKSSNLTNKYMKSPKSCGCRIIRPDNKIKMEGKTFGRFLVLKEEGEDSAGVRFLCKCSCGNLRNVRGSSLRNGTSSSCGCLNREIITGHGMSKTTTYRSWGSAKSRCRNPKSRHYERYGGRGIDICDSWYNSFECFLGDMGERPEGMTLDRIDNNKGYFKENCKWSTPIEQSSNRDHTTPSLSKYRGVFYKKSNGRWYANLSGYGKGAKSHYAGTFDTDLEAALAYDEKIREMGMQAHRRFNFPKNEGEVQAPYRDVIQLDDPRHIMTKPDKEEP